MKKLIYIMLLFTTLSFSQTNIINTNDCTTTIMDEPAGSYFKDIGNEFLPFLGTWKYQNGNNILIFKLEKVTQWYEIEYGSWEDFIKGNYSYSNDGGLSYVTNSIITNIGVNNHKLNPIFCFGVTNNTIIECGFRDVLYNKGWNEITFKFVSGSTTQMTFKIVDPGVGVFPGDPPRPDGFSIPTEGIVIKQ